MPGDRRSSTCSASNSSGSSSASTTSARSSTALGHPERAFRSVHVAGTNGKGSVTAMVDAALRAAGHRSGPLHVAASRRSHRAVRRRWSADAERRAEPAVDTRARRRRSSCSSAGASTCIRHSSRSRRRRPSNSSGAPRSRWPSAKSGSAAASTPPTSYLPMVTAITSIALRSPAVPRARRWRRSPPKRPASSSRGCRSSSDPWIPTPRACIARRRARPRGAAGRGARRRHVEAMPAPTRRRPDDSPAHAANGLRRARRCAGGPPSDRQRRGRRARARSARRGGTGCAADGDRRRAWRPSLAGRLERITPRRRPRRCCSMPRTIQPAPKRSRLPGARGARRPLVFAAMRDKDVARHSARRCCPCVSALVLTRASNPRSADPRSLAAIARALAPGSPITSRLGAATRSTRPGSSAQHIVVAGSIFCSATCSRSCGRT